MSDELDAQPASVAATSTTKMRIGASYTTSLIPRHNRESTPQWGPTKNLPDIFSVHFTGGRVHARAFLDALDAGGPAPDRGQNMELYGWLVGSWELDVTRYGEDG